MTLFTPSSWRICWLGGIQAFADAELQRLSWLDMENRNPAWSPEEFLCSYLNDTLHSPNDYRWALARGLIRPEEMAAVALDELLHKYQPPPGRYRYDREQILNDPAWQRIVEEAKLAQGRLLELLTDPEERRYLLERPDWRSMRGN